MRAPLVSIVIDNYNYGRYLRQAIDSALSQTYDSAEVIVVDDGSTDDSRAIIDGYGSRIIAMFKPNGGQGSAFNAGIGHARGDFVKLLDADDILYVECVQAVVDAFAARPECACVQLRLDVIDAHGTPAGMTNPPVHRSMPTGDLRSHVARYRDFGRPPTTGLAFRRASLDRILPIPEDLYRYNADQYLSLASALVGSVVSLNQPGGGYRLHASNAYATSRLDLEGVRSAIKRANCEHAYLRAIARREGIDSYAEHLEDMDDIVLLNARMVSRKFAPKQHPIAGDRLWALARRGTTLAARYPGMPRRWRVLQAGWFMAMLVAPRRIARNLAEYLFVPARRGRLGHFVARVRSR